MKVTMTIEPEDFGQVGMHYRCAVLSKNIEGSHEETAIVDPSFCADAGTPICPDCGDEMELMYVTVEFMLDDLKPLKEVH